ncbi:MAG: hypothetical protein IJT65_05030 [Eubacterium sp.]|nr:hypothetical protein [Eubacterium sp.]
MKNLCDECWYNTYDEEGEEYFCSLSLDEDEYARFISDSENNKPCRYFRPDTGEYSIVKKQN